MGSPSEGRQFYNVGGAHRQFGTMDPNARAMAERNEVPLDEVRRQPVEHEPETAKFHGLPRNLLFGEDDEDPGSLFGEQEIFDETPASRQMGEQKDVNQRTYGLLRDYPVATRKMVKTQPFEIAWPTLKSYDKVPTYEETGAFDTPPPTPTDPRAAPKQHPDSPHDTHAGSTEEANLAAQEEADEAARLKLLAEYANHYGRQKGDEPADAWMGDESTAHFERMKDLGFPKGGPFKGPFIGEDEDEA